MATRFRWLLFTSLLCISSPSYSGVFNDGYDAEIQDAVRQRWVDLPIWRLWKAQLWQESKLDPNVCSSVGACGVAQFMLPTWRGILKDMRYTGNEPRSDARLSIQAGAYYQARMRLSWNAAKRSGVQRNDLGAASYNAGLGSIIAAQRRCQDAVLWEAIAPCLESVTSPEHARETTGYVVAIHRFWKLMEATP